MIKRFFDLRNCVQKALIDLNSIYAFNINDADFKHISSLIAMLAPLSLAVEAMCRRDASLLTANVTVSFMLNQLDKLDDEVAIEFTNSLKDEIIKR